MSSQTEKDNFWLYIRLLVAAVIVVLMMVKGGEHDKYAKMEATIAEDAANFLQIATRITTLQSPHMIFQGPCPPFFADGCVEKPC